MGRDRAGTIALTAAMGCELAQGYHLAPPMPAAEATAWLAARPAGRFTMPAAERG